MTAVIGLLLNLLGIMTVDSRFIQIFGHILQILIPRSLSGHDRCTPILAKSSYACVSSCRT